MTQNQTGTLRSAAAARGIKAITVEIGNPQLFQNQYIQVTKRNKVLSTVFNDSFTIVVLYGCHAYLGSSRDVSHG